MVGSRSPVGLEFARYSIDYHYLRNWLYLRAKWGPKRADRHIPDYAKRIIQEYLQGPPPTTKEEEEVEKKEEGGGWWPPPAVAEAVRRTSGGSGGWLEELDGQCQSNADATWF